MKQNKNQNNNPEDINIDEVPKILALIELCELISKKYTIPNAFEVAIKGLKRGLGKYYDRIMTGREKVDDIQTYLEWFIRTALDYESGIENEETKLWKWD